MASAAFDPHPFGCPVALRVSPADMSETVTAFWMKLRDVLHASIYVVNPSKGGSYPVLFMFADTHDAVPRVAIFPGWEDDVRSPKRRVDYARQTSLLERIHTAGVRGESLEQFRGMPSDRFGPGELMLPLAVNAEDMDAVVHDLFERLGSLLRITVARVAQARGRPPIDVVRIYVLDDEKRPRVVLFPGWACADGPEIDRQRMQELLAQTIEQRIAEVPIEALFT